MSDPRRDASDDAATPLSPEEQAQIIPTYITTRAELNESEQLNAASAIGWRPSTPSPTATGATLGSRPTGSPSPWGRSGSPGATRTSTNQPARAADVRALKAADDLDIDPLRTFARS